MRERECYSVTVCIITAVEGNLCNGLCAVDGSSRLCRILRKKCNEEARAAESSGPRDSTTAVCCSVNLDARGPCDSSRTVQKPNEAIVNYSIVRV